MSLHVIHKDHERNTALVKADDSTRSVPVVMADWLKHLVCIGDIAIIKKNHVTGEIILTDYVRNLDNIGGEINE